MKKISWQSVREKWPLFLSLAVILALTLYNLDKLNIIHILNDEYGYWAGGAFLAGKDWSDVTAHSYYYSYGYSVILSFLIRLFSSGEMLYKAAAAVNVIFLALAYFVTAYVIKRIFSKNQSRWIYLLALFITLYPNTILQTQINWSETLLYLLFWLEAAVLYMLWEKPGHVKAALAALIVSYMFMVHQRSLAIVVSASIMMIVMMICRKIKRSHFLCFACVIAAMLCLHFALKDVFITVLYQGSSSVTGNDFSGQYAKIREILTSWKGMAKAITGFIGKLFYIGSSTLGVAFVALYSIIKECILDFKAYRKEGTLSCLTVFGLFSVLSAIFAMGISTVFMLNGDRIDSVIYGRYTEYTIGPLIFIGFWVLLSRKIRPWEYAICLGGLLICGVLTAIRMQFVPTAEFNVIPNVGLSLFYKDGQNGVLSTVKLEVFLLIVSCLCLSCYGIFKEKTQIFKTIILGLCSVFWLGTIFYIGGIIEAAQTSLYSAKELTDVIENYSVGDNITIDYITEYDDWDSRSIEYIQFLLPDARINYYDIRNQENLELTSSWRIYNVEEIFYCMEDSDLLASWQNLRLAVDAQSPEGKRVIENDFPVLSAGNKYYLLNDQNMASQTAAASGEWSNNGQEGFLVYGPYTTLEQGEYELEIQLKVSGAADASETTSIGYIDVCSGGKEIARMDIWAGDSKITVPFALNEDMDQMEFRVFVSADNHLQIDQMVLVQPDRQ